MTLNLNLGCGPFRAPRGWLNIDHPASEFAEDIDADIYTLIQDLPFKDDTVDKIYAGHVLEHIPLEEVPDTLLELMRVLAPDGTLMVVGPDMDRIEAIDHEAWLDEAMRVDNDGPPGIHHRWVPTAANTLALMENAGFFSVTETPLQLITEKGWPLVAYTPWSTQR